MADVSITAANVLPSTQAVIIRGVAGATITAGQPLYLDSATGTYKLAINNVSASANVVGIALQNVATGQSLDICISDPSFTTGFTLVTTVAGAKGLYVLSATAGGVCPLADLIATNYVNHLYTAISSTKAILKITTGVVALT